MSKIAIANSTTFNGLKFRDTDRVLKGKSKYQAWSDVGSIN